MEYSGAGGKLIHEKNQRQKISWHCPFKYAGILGWNLNETTLGSLVFDEPIQSLKQSDIEVCILVKLKKNLMPSQCAW